jgi:hypothetical protein
MRKSFPLIALLFVGVFSAPFVCLAADQYWISFGGVPTEDIPNKARI